MSATRSPATVIAARYATAIFSLAYEAGKADRVVAEMAGLARAISAHPPLAAALSSPLLGRDKKAALLTALTSKADPMTLQALATIVGHGRADSIVNIAHQLEVSLTAARGEVVAQVESARPLPASVQKQLVESLSRATGKVVQLQLKENPELLGGLAVQIGSQRLDATLSAALSTMRRSLLATNA